MLLFTPKLAVMKTFLAILIVLCSWGLLPAQDSMRPAYCDEFPVESGTYALAVSQKTVPLPRFATRSIKEYKVQVALLRNSDPRDFPFHSKLIARFRPCEQVWVVESRDSFPSRTDAEALRNELTTLGYPGCYITEIIAYR